MKGFSLAFILVLSTCLAAFAQQTIREIELQAVSSKEKDKDLSPALPVLKNITLLSSENGQKMLLVVNPPVKTELFNSSERRNEITALPGFMSLGINLSENEMRVCIQDEFVNQYLKNYFGFSETELAAFNF